MYGCDVYRQIKEQKRREKERERGEKGERKKERKKKRERDRERKFSYATRESRHFCAAPEAGTGPMGV